MEQIRKYMENAENCIELAEKAKNAPSRVRYMRLAEGWLALVHEQEMASGQNFAVADPYDYLETRASLMPWPSPVRPPLKGSSLRSFS
jgi:hypothetical protein